MRKIWCGIASFYLMFGICAAQEDDSVAEPRREGIFERAGIDQLPFRFSYSAGLEYDSNVSALDIDATTNEGDFAAQLEFGVEGEQDLGSRTTLTAGYNFSQDLQFDFTDFNTQIHRGSVQVEHDFGGLKGGAAYQFIYARLGGAGFLSQHRINPFISTYIFDKKALLRVGYLHAAKAFNGRPDRDSSVNAGTIDGYWFLNGSKTYVLAGYRFERENASSPEFDFNSHNLKARLNHRISVAGRRMTLKAGGRYEDRNYKSITPSIGAVRDDVRYSVETSAELALTKSFYIEAAFDYDIFNSNLPALDFRQRVASVRFGGEF